MVTLSPIGFGSCMTALFARALFAVSYIKHGLKGLLMALLLAGLTGCGGSSNLATSLGLNNTNKDAAKEGQAVKQVAFARLVGAPASLSPKLLGAMRQAAATQNWQITQNSSKADYLLHGHYTAYPTKSGAKLSYIWDVKDQKGVHLHRVMGSEAIKGKVTSNAWSLVNDQVIRRVAFSATGKLNGWYAKQLPANKRPAVDTPIRAKHIAKIAETKKEPLVEPVVTGAVGKRTGPLFTYVKPVSGAPGDGRISLTNSLRRELKKNGIALKGKKQADTYTVEGLVKLQKPVGDRQKIEIVWNVFDAKGHRVGTVSQKNAVPNGSLNGAWGPTADAAASAAAKGIVKLLPNGK